jgi:predicted nucleic acid-binding Zn ribbon protein
MPTFNFKCGNCKTVFVGLVIGDRPVLCPECKCDHHTKLLTLPKNLKMKFKGKGFHATDYRKDMVLEYV